MKRFEGKPFKDSAKMKKIGHFELKFKFDIVLYL